MKKTVVFLCLLLSLAACRNFEEAPISTSAADETSLSSNGGNFSLVASLSRDTTKTHIGDDGFKVYWDKGDEITVVYSYKKNGAIKYKALTMTLDNESAGLSKGLFKGTLPGNDLSEFNPVFACYPANTAIQFTSLQEFTGFSFNNILTQNSSLDSIACGNFKAAANFSESKHNTTGSGNNLSTSCNFEELGTLLDFVIVPSEELDGDILRRVSFSCTSQVSGDYKYGLNSGKVSISSVGSEEKDKNVTVNIEGDNVLTASSPIHLYMTTLPGVEENEPVTIHILTDKHDVTVIAKAKCEYLPGYKYSMDLDLASIPGDKCTVSSLWDFTKIEDRLGVFDLQNGEDLFTTFESDIQYGFSGTTARLQSWSSGEIYYISGFPSGVHEVNSGMLLTLKKLSEKTSSPLSLVVARRDGNRYWLKTEDEKTGYIIEKEN